MNYKVKPFLSMLSVSLVLVIALHTTAQSSETVPQTAKILQSWHGDYPVDKLGRLPENQREHGIGYIENADSFNRVWKAFKPGEDVPEVDFKTNLVLFARNTRFYNRIRIGQVNLKNGVAEVLAMETMSAMPVEDRVAMSLAVVSGKGIKCLKVGEDIIQLPNLSPGKKINSEVTK